MDSTTKFVELVKSYPCLYNTTLQTYSKKDLTEKAWSHIAKEMNLTAADSKEKWRNIRNSFVRSLKPPCGSFSREKKPYYMRDLMEFVIPYCKPFQNLEHTGNAILPDSDSQYSEDVDLIETSEDNKSEIMLEIQKRRQDTPAPLENKKMKYSDENYETDQTALQQIPDKEETKALCDAQQMFLLSLLPDVKKLTDARLRQFKVRTLILLDELLSEQEQTVAGRSFSDHYTDRVAQASSSERPSTSCNDLPAGTSVIYSSAVDCDPNDSCENKSLVFASQ